MALRNRWTVQQSKGTSVATKGIAKSGDEAATLRANGPIGPEAVRAEVRQADESAMPDAVHAVPKDTIRFMLQR